MSNSCQTVEDVRIRTFLKEKELWLLVLIGVLYFYRPFFLGESFFFRDLYLNIFPQKQLLVDFFQAGELPLWSPYLSGGRPYLADIPYFTLYPSNALYLFFSPLKAFNINIIMHVIAAACCAYLLARIIHFEPVASLVTGLIYGFCGYTLSLANHGCRLLSMPYLPLLLLFWHRYMLKGKRRYFVMACIAGGLQVFSGTAEMNVMSLLFVLLWTFNYPYPEKTISFKIFQWGLLGFCVLGLAAIQIIPTVEMISLSTRQQGLNYEAFSAWSLNPRRLPELVFPHFLGFVDTLTPRVHYWGGQLFEGKSAYIISLYFGWGTVIFAIAGVLRSCKKDFFPVRMRIFLLCMIIGALLLSFGRFFPFFSLLYAYVPLIKIFRFPIKFLLIAVLPLALLTGYACHVFFGRDVSLEPSGERHKPTLELSSSSKCFSQHLLMTLWGFSVLLMVLLFVGLLAPDLVERFSGMMFQKRGEVVRQGLLASAGHAALFCLLFTLLYSARQNSSQNWQPWLFASIVMLDLLVAGTYVNPYAPESFFTEIPENVLTIHANRQGGRLFHDAETIGDYKIQAPANDIMWRYRWYLEILTEYKAVFYRIPVVFHEEVDGLGQKYLYDLTRQIRILSWKEKLPLLSAGAVSLIIAGDGNLSVPGMQKITELPNYSNLSFYLYRNTKAAASVQFVTQGDLVDSDRRARAVMISPDYDPREYVVLQKPDPTLFQRKQNFPPQPFYARGNQDCPPARVSTSSSTMNTRHIAVSNACDGYLVFSEAYYPGWHVVVDGEATPIYRANYAFSAIFLPVGTHRIERFYRPNSVMIGAVISLVFCGILGGGALKK